MSETKSTLCPAHDLLSLLRLVALLVDHSLRITDDVDKEDMPDLKLNFFLNVSGHPVKLPENKSIIISLLVDRREQSWRFRKANRAVNNLLNFLQSVYSFWIFQFP